MGTELRTSGIYGIRRGETPTELAATVPLDTGIPESFDGSQGLDKTFGFGNLQFSNCFWAMVANVSIFQALTGVNDRQQPVFVDGFTPPTQHEPVVWWERYLAAQGTPFTGKPPGPGTGLYSGAQSVLDQGLAEYAAVLGPTIRDADGNYSYDPQVVRQAIYEFSGGAGFCLALDPKAMQEFARHEPWGTLSTKPDAELGHAVDGVAYSPSGVVFWTWSEPEMSTDQFDLNCIDGIILLITKGYVTKIGEQAAVSLAARWGMTKAASVEQPQGRVIL